MTNGPADNPSPKEHTMARKRGRSKRRRLAKLKRAQQIRKEAKELGFIDPNDQQAYIETRTKLEEYGYTLFYEDIFWIVIDQEENAQIGAYLDIEHLRTSRIFRCLFPEPQQKETQCTHA